ncbi:MAG: ATP-binding protein [bacterium]
MNTESKTNKQYLPEIVNNAANVGFNTTILTNLNLIDSLIFENLYSSIIIIDLNFTIIGWNKEQERLSGIDRKAVLGRNLLQRFPNFKKEGIDLLISEVMFKGNLLVEKEGYYTDMLDVPKVLNLKILPLYSLKKEIGGTVIIVDDITEIARSEENLQKKIETATLELKNAYQEIEFKNRELVTMYEISQVLQGVYTVEEKLYIILTALTAREGFGFNRALLLFVNEEDNTLEGKMGVGPISGEEANEIWRALAAEKKDMYDYIETHSRDQEFKIFSKFDSMVRDIKIPIQVGTGVPATIVLEKKSMIIKGPFDDKLVNKQLSLLLCAREFAAVPLIVKSRVVGIFIVDNAFTSKLISEEKLKSLMIFSNQAAIAIENSKLYHRLREQIEALANANEEISRTQSRLVRYETLATMGKLAAGVAHEIRNPLNSMAINIQLLKDELVDLGLDKGGNPLELITVIKEEIDRLEKLVKEFLSYARPPRLKIEKVDIHELLDQVLCLIRYQEEFSKIKLFREFNQEINCVWLDCDQIKRAFLNVILNAIQAMPEGGTLQLSTGFCSLDDSERIWFDNSNKLKKETIYIKIQDTGCGIRKEDLTRLFEPFFTTKLDGTGLGLPIVERIIREHDGHIQFSSTLGKGTEVCIVLPHER